MREMNLEELNLVSGAITWDSDTCQGTFMVGGIILGAIGGSFTVVGGWAGAAIGGTAGGFAGELVCPILTK